MFRRQLTNLIQKLLHLELLQIGGTRPLSQTVLSSGHQPTSFAFADQHHASELPDDV
jgi:hypothetical protein